jgi:hypothetical protein
VFVQFGVVFLEFCNAWITWEGSIVDPSYECSQCRVIVESSQLFGNLNKFLNLLGSVFLFVVAQNQRNDPVPFSMKTGNVIIIVHLPIC